MFVHAVSSPACIASTSPPSRQQERIDSPSRYFGLSLPVLIKRIGIMAAEGPPLPARFGAASRRRVSRLAVAQPRRQHQPWRSNMRARAGPLA